MKKQFALKPAKALKAIKVLATKHELTNKLGFSALTKCCEAGPVLPMDRSALAL